MDFTQLIWLAMSVLLWIIQGASPTKALPGKNRQERQKRAKGKNFDATEPLPTPAPQLPSLFQARSRSGASPSSSNTKGGGGSSPQTKNCCMNGGLCVMGVFCHCPEKFYGFRCEYERVPCGTIQHDQWARLGCNLCRCFNAQLHCLANVYSGCAGRPVKENVLMSDYTDEEVEIFPMDHETSGSAGEYGIYDDYYYDDYDDSVEDYSYEDGYEVDGVESANTKHKNSGGPRHKKKHRGRGKKGAAVLISSPSLPLLCLCWLMSIYAVRYFLSPYEERNTARSFVS